MLRSTAILGNLRHMGGVRVRDFVDIEWFDAQKRIARWHTRGGLELGFKLEGPSQGLRDGDIIFSDEGGAVVINVLPTEAICVSVSPQEIAKFCYEIGNRHASLYYGDDPLSFKTPFEMPIKILCEKLGVAHVVLKSKLDISKRVSLSSPHGQAVGALRFTDSPDLQIVMQHDR